VLLGIATPMKPAMAQQSERQAEPVASASPIEDGIHDVRIGLYLADLVEVSGSSQSFLADVMMLASWTDPALVGEFEKTSTVDASDVWHPLLLIVNQRSVSQSLPESVTVDPDGSVRSMQRFTGTFSAVMDLRSFPLDRQQLTIWVVAPRRVGEPVRLLVDESLTALRNDRLSISDWRVDELELIRREFRATVSATAAPGIELSIEVQRQFTYYVIQVIVPLLAIMLMPWAVFWIAPATINVRVGVVVTTMLTLIAYRFALANHVPRLSYLTRLDWFLLGATALVMLTLGTMAFSAYLVGSGRESQVQRIDRVARVLYPSLVIVFTLVVWVE
jgi:anionic glutamate receptor